MLLSSLCPQGFFRVTLILVGVSFIVSCAESDNDKRLTQTAMANESLEYIEAAYMPMPTKEQTTASVYFIVNNHGDMPLAFNYLHTDIAENIVVQRVIYQNGELNFHTLRHYSLASRKTQVFSPRTYRLLLEGIQPEDFHVGMSFPIVFEFEGNLKETVNVEVKRH